MFIYIQILVTNDTISKRVGGSDEFPTNFQGSK